MNIDDLMRCGQVISCLTKSELLVLRSFAEGLTREQVAARRCISLPTVDSHKTKILKKCDVWQMLPGEKKRDYHFLYEKFAPLGKNDDVWILLPHIAEKHLLQNLPTILSALQYPHEMLSDQERDSCAQVIAQLKKSKSKFAVLWAIVGGLNRDQIAQQLGLSTKTVDGYIAAIFELCENVGISFPDNKHNYKFLKRKFVCFFQIDGMEDE